MITYDNTKKTFRLDTKNTTYIFGITKYKHLESIYYGDLLDSKVDIYSLSPKYTSSTGTTTYYDKDDDLYSLNNILLEYSGVGKGDYRVSPIEVQLGDSSFVSDFVYLKHTVTNSKVEMNTLPVAYQEDSNITTLIVRLKEISCDVFLNLHYQVFFDKDIIVRWVTLENKSMKSINIRKIMSMNLDIVCKDYKLITLSGSWANETHVKKQDIFNGVYINQSLTGNSSNKHNPGFIISKESTNEDYGECYGFNLIYSGNHLGLIELNNFDFLRIQLGINNFCFSYDLAHNKIFETPQAILTYSKHGFNKLSQNFHNFINDNIIRGDYKNKERPILINEWESFMFDFNQKKLLSLAKKAKSLGIELFVLDDGWFKNRNNDTKALGDYEVNLKKIPRGLKNLSSRIHKLGLKFGLWVEPEMISYESDLYLKHPEYLVKVPSKDPSQGRHQYVLDIIKEEVQEYIIGNVTKLIDENNIDYIKWDMNRNISDMYSSVLENQGEFFHRYIISLYHILKEIFIKRPSVYLETCASGGNRFDLGMLCFSTSIWASDNTDPVERIDIQKGLSYFYPLSSISSHVSLAPHQQTLRNSPFSTRFNVSSFGVLGYELNLKYLTKVELLEVKEDIKFYKKYRHIFQFGEFYRIFLRDNQYSFQCKSDTSNVVSFFQNRYYPTLRSDILKVKGLDSSKNYEVSSKNQKVYISSFGHLVNFISKIKINPTGFIFNFIAKRFSLDEVKEKYFAQGSLLESGLLLTNQFQASYYNKTTRLLNDFGSKLYIVEELQNE
ncbi:MAG: alpha-galactosidase [Acholeplasmatales bacterium]|jgi:alpha-galactosidase|nr:alpha-galactosidase [Acholeplasmatales bacterium]